MHRKFAGPKKNVHVYDYLKKICRAIIFKVWKYFYLCVFQSANSQRSLSKASQKSGKSQTSGAEDTVRISLMATSQNNILIHKSCQILIHLYTGIV